MLTLDQVKEYLKVTTSEHDDVLTGLMGRAIETVQRTLDWYFSEPRETTETLDGTGTHVLFIRQPPSDGELTVENRSSMDDAWEELDADEWEREGRGVYHRTYWTRGLRNYRLSYMEGFETPPGDVAQLTLDLIASKWHELGKAGLTSEKLGRYSYTKKDLEGLEQWNAVVMNWRRLRVH